MFRNREISIQRFMVITMLVIMLPVNFLTIALCGDVLRQMNQEWHVARQESMDQFVAQVQIRLDQTQQYMLQQVEDSLNLQREYTKGELEYETAKTGLKTRLERQINGAYASSNLVDGIFAYVKTTGELIEARNEMIPSDGQMAEIRSWIKSADTMDWKVVYMDDTPYLGTVVGNAVISIGAVVRFDSISEEWNQNSDMSCMVLDREKETFSGDDTVLVSSFEDGRIVMLCKIADIKWYGGVPVLYQILFILLIISALLTIQMFRLFREKMVQPLYRIASTMQTIREVDSETRIVDCDTVRELSVVQNTFNDMMNRIRGLKIKTYEMEIENQKIHLMNLQMQMNPHLLLNSMNTIYSLAEIEDYESLKKFTMYLVKYFRYSLNRIDKVVTVGEELRFVESYVGIQKIRYPGKFDFIYDVEEEVMQLEIPPLIIENFVENSMKYSRKSFGTEIIVSIRLQREHITISICDDGGGIEEDILKKINQDEPFEKNGEIHVGIWNCRRRLMLQYGEEAKVKVTSCGTGTQVFMELPIGRNNHESAHC